MFCPILPQILLASVATCNLQELAMEDGQRLKTGD